MFKERYGAGPVYPHELQLTFLSLITQSQIWMQVFEERLSDSVSVFSLIAVLIMRSQNEHLITSKPPSIYKTGPRCLLLHMLKV